MAVGHTVLAELARGERYGYELRRSLEERLGRAWRLDFGQLYRVLRTLSAKGLVESRLEPGRQGPPRKVYVLTPAGRAEVARWLAAPATPRPRRDHAAAQVRLGASLGRGDTGGPLLVSGSDDPVLDLLARTLAAQHADIRFATMPVGSLSGLIALYEQRAHLAGVHLLDLDSGEYNVPYVKHLLPGQRVVLVHVANREQGLMLAPGNPKRLRSLRDLTRRGIRIVNRQAGAGTRLLLHHRLRAARIDPSRIAGYEQELPTHGAVAAAIASGAADAGPGVRAAADVHGLDFLPLGEERYDLAMPQPVFDSRALRPLLDALHAADFRRQAAQFSGYDVTAMGRVVGTVG